MARNFQGCGPVVFSSQRGRRALRHRVKESRVFGFGVEVSDLGYWLRAGVLDNLLSSWPFASENQKQFGVRLQIFVPAPAPTLVAWGSVSRRAVHP